MLVHEGSTYILASSLLAEHRVRVLKHHETFAVFDQYGELMGSLSGEEGLYHQGTRHLSHAEFSLGYLRPLLLSSNISGDNLLLAIDLTNPDCLDVEGRPMPRGSLHIFKSLFLSDNCCFERIKISNFSGQRAVLPLIYRFGADFRDVFEVRGHTRERRGELMPASWRGSELEFSYMGLDRILRSTRISVEAEAKVQKRSDGFELMLDVKDHLEVMLRYECVQGNEKVTAAPGFGQAHSIRQRALAENMEEECKVTTSNQEFNRWLGRSYSDMRMMISQTPHGPYPYAGVPWFSTTFGRDGIITALQMLWVNPDIAKGVLSFLARTQAKEIAPERDAEPGKILHEARTGEMANLDEIPFRSYYGSVDSTPLFVVLAGEYLKATGDIAFLSSIWGNIERALDWIRDFGDADKDGFVEYSRQSRHGLVSQGWKDSADSIFHHDGTDVEAPVALSEVQGYVYQAKIWAAYIARRLGKDPKNLESEAMELKDQFHRAFWCEEIGTYAIALDGKKRPCKVLSSNAGHCLFSGIAREDAAERVAETLMSEKSFCGWGIRTIAEGEARYNPMSYHNGSVWPHDTAICALGLARYGKKEHACRLLDGLFQTSRAVDLNRLPELFCGFQQRPEQGPTLYPMSCAPQAWAAGSVFALLQACLGLSLDAFDCRVILQSPVLPSSLTQVNLTGLRLGERGRVDLEIVKRAEDVSLHVVRRDGKISVISMQ